jgi:DNA-binding transcriptional ArsR family regulator
MPTRRRPRARARTPARLALRDLAQVRALSHPLRLQLLELFGQRPRTTKQAAEALRQPPTRLYHHVGALERAGLVRLRETRPNRGTVEKYYELAARQFEVPSSTTRRVGASPRSRSSLGLLLFEQARADFVRALADPDIDPQTMIAARGLVMLSPSSARTMVKRLQALFAGVVGPGRGAAGKRRRRYALTIALLPADATPEHD